MADLFVYGTLRHRPLLDLVLGHAGAVTEPAVLHGHRAVWAAGESFPLIVAGEAGDAAHGLLLRGLTPADIARLDFYEIGFGYGTRVLRVETAEGPVGALVYWPDAGFWTPGPDFDLADWAARWGPLSMDAAAEVMGYFGQLTSREVASRFGSIRARAWARHLAAARPAPQTLRSLAGAAAPQITPRPGGFDGFFRLRRINARHTRFDGTVSAPVDREVYIAFDAALVLPYDPVHDRVLVVEQFRYGPAMRGDPAPRVFEPVAGMVDAGEDPAETARREAREEAGLTLADIRPMTGAYAAPGYATDFFHCFYALCDLDGAGGRVGGHPDEDEDIRTHVLSFDRAMALVESGEINIAPLAMMLLWLDRLRPALRAAAAG